MLRTRKTFHVVTLLAAFALAADVMVACSTEHDTGGPSLNPQPLPPNDEKTEGPKDPGSFGGDDDGVPSSGSSGSSGSESEDAGASSSGAPADAGES